jgi:N-acetylneuraminic acid mutarotase
MKRWKWPLRWFLPLASLFMLLTSSQAAPALMTHTTVADFSGGDGDGGFTLAQYRDGEMTLTSRAIGVAPWTELASRPLPQILYEHTAIAVNGYLFVVGGRNSGGLQQTVYRAAILANGALGSWQPMPALPQPLHLHAMVKAGGGLLVIGGQRGLDPDETVATVYRAAVAADGDLSNWVDLTETPLPQPLKSLGAVVVNGYLFVIGGVNDNGSQSTVYRASLKADGTLDGWTVVTPLPVPLSDHAVATAGRCIFVTGGYSNLGESSQVYSAAVGANGEIAGWQELANARLPQPLTGHTVTVVGGQLVVVGGNSGAPDFDRDEVYRATIHADCTLGSWEELTGAALLRRVNDHATAAAEGYLFVTGGHRAGNFDQYAAVYRVAVVFDQNLGGWRELGQTPLPQPLSAHAAAFSGDHLFVTGGLGTNGVQSTVYRGNALTEAQVGPWAQVTALPQPLHEHVTIAIGDRLLTVGGHNGSADQDTVHEAVVNSDGSLGAWRSHPCALPVALSSHAVASTNGTVYLGGGRRGFDEQNQVYRLRGDDDGSQGCWQPVTPLPEPLAEHAMAATDDYVFVSGGVTGRGSDGRDTVYSATIRPDGSLGTWTALSDTPLPRFLRSHTMMAANGYLYVAGGFEVFALDYQYQVYRAKIEADGSLETWEELVLIPLPQALANHAAVVTDLYLLVIGGYRNSQPQDDIYVAPLRPAAHQAIFIHQFDLGSNQDIGVLDWQARGDPGALLSARFRVATDDARYGPWSEAFTSPPLPVYEQGRYLQYHLLVENPNGGVKAVDEVGITYGDVGDYVKAVDESGAGIPDAEVYLNGQLVGTTGVRGVLPPEALPQGLHASDRLAVLSLITQTSTIRQAHTTPDSNGANWAYRTYLTNLEVITTGQVLPYTVTHPGGQVIRLSRDRPLVFYNLLVSIEWDATVTYTRQISRAVRLASDCLYDLSEGQMALGYVTIYDNATYWGDADLQISTKNTVHPHAYVGGLTATDKSHVIRVGRYWDGQTGNQGPWDEQDGYRTLIHEFGHYALYLYDEYFAYVFDQDGNLVREVPAYCTGPENRNPATDATNASVMDYQYTTSELGMRGVPGLWSELCEQTAQWQLNGESDWETVVRRYADPLGPPRWEFTTPADRGSVVAGPTVVSSDTLPFPLVGIHNSGPSGPPRKLTVYGPQGPCEGALVALYTNQGGHPVAIDQGFTDWRGEIDIYGAQAGDTLRAASFDGALSGSVSVTDATTYTIVMAPVTSLQALAIPGLNPYLTLRPSSDGDTLYLRLCELGPGGTLVAIVTQSGGSASQPTALIYSSAEEVYVGAVTFAPHVRQGTGTVQVIGAGGNSQGISLNSTYALQAIPRHRLADLYSADGNLQVHLITGTLPFDAYAVLSPLSATPIQPPAGLQIVGNVYDVKLSGLLDAAPADQPFVLKLHYDPEILKGDFIGPDTLQIYRWEPDPDPHNPTDQARWVALGGSRLEEDNSVSIATDRFGIYTLMGFRVAESIYLPLIMTGW